jgi:hypothetical protein
MVLVLALTAPVNAQQQGSSTRIESWLRQPAVGVMPETALPPGEYCRDFLERNAGHGLRCGVVRYPGGMAAITLDEPDTSPQPPNNQEKYCDEAFAVQVERVEAPLFDRAQPFPEAPQLAEINASLKAIAEQYTGRLVTLLDNSNCARVRKAAAGLLRFTHMCRGAATHVLPFLNDHDFTVRNGAAQCINTAVIFMTTPDRLRATDMAFEQLDRPNHSDRNKSLGIIQNAMTADPQVVAHVRDHYLLRLQRVADNSALPNVGGLAKELLKKISVAPTVLDQPH